MAPLHKTPPVGQGKCRSIPNMPTRGLKCLPTALPIMDATRWRLYNPLQTAGLPVGGPRGRTKMQRFSTAFRREHIVTYGVRTKGPRNTPCIFRRMYRFGKARGGEPARWVGRMHIDFPIRHRSRQEAYGGFRIGNGIKAKVPKRKCAGIYIGRVLVRTNGRFNIKHRVAPGNSCKHCSILQRKKGWLYAQKPVSA